MSVCLSADNNMAIGHQPLSTLKFGKKTCLFSVCVSVIGSVSLSVSQTVCLCASACVRRCTKMSALSML